MMTQFTSQWLSDQVHMHRPVTKVLIWDDNGVKIWHDYKTNLYGLEHAGGRLEKLPAAFLLGMLKELAR